MGTSVSCANSKNSSSTSTTTTSSSMVDTRGHRGGNNNRNTRTFLSSNQQSRTFTSDASTCNTRRSSIGTRHHFAESERKFTASVKATSKQFGSKDEQRSNSKYSSDLRRGEWQKSKEVQLTRTTMSKHKILE